MKADDKDREEIAARLRALQQVEDASDQQMGHAAGVSRQVWSNYVSRSPNPKNRRMISIEAVRQLKKNLKVTGEWVFLGDASTLPDPEMRRKLLAALANPDPPKSPGRKPRHK